MDEFAKLKKLCDEYEAAPRAEPVTFDWSALLTIIPIILQLFVKDPALRAIIQQIVTILSGLFTAKPGGAQ